MKVLLDASVLEAPATGIAKATVGLWRACMDLMPRLTVTAVHRKPLQCAPAPRVRAAQIAPWLSRRSWRRIALPLYASLHRPNVIHFPFNGGVPRLFASAAVVATIHDVLPLVIPQHFASDQARAAYCAAVQRDLDRSHLVVTDSQYSRAQILKHFRVHAEPVVVHLAPDPPPSIATAAVEPGDYFIYVGGYAPRKGVDRLVSIFLDLHREKRLSSRLILAASKQYFSDDFRRLIETGAERGVLQETGYVTDDELFSLLSRAKALVYLSQYEGFGLPPLEAMSVGCPVITTGCAAIPEVCGGAVLYVDPDDEAHVAAALMRVETDPGLRQRLSAQGRAQASKFSWKASAEKFLDALHRVLEARGPA
jgi:glycosyltransferase involved in cell wall biosynthesis